MKKIIISGATQGLGEAMVLNLLKKEDLKNATILGFSRSEKNLRALKESVDSLLGRGSDRVILVQGDISSESDRHNIVSIAKRVLCKVDLLINNVGIFGFDDEMTESDKQKMHGVNLAGNAAFISEVLEKVKIPEKLTIADVGSIGAVAELAGRPFTNTALYGATKAALALHSLSLAHGNYKLRVRIAHPGPFGESAQRIADKFGDTWAVRTEKVAEFALNLFLNESEEKVLQGIIASSRHFSWEHFGDIDNLGIEGLREESCLRVENEDSIHLRKQNNKQ